MSINNIIAQGFNPGAGLVQAKQIENQREEQNYLRGQQADEKAKQWMLEGIRRAENIEDPQARIGWIQHWQQLGAEKFGIQTDPLDDEDVAFFENLPRGQRPSKRSLVKVKGPGGEPVFMTQEEAAGMQAYTAPQKAPKTVMAMDAEGNPFYATEEDVLAKSLTPYTKGASSAIKERLRVEAGGQKVPTLTPAQKKLDEKFAGEYAEFIAGGGLEDVEKQLDQLNQVSAALRESDTLTGPIAGSYPKWVREVVNPESVETQEAVEEVVQRNLRLVLGAQFTEKEGERLIARAYNPRLDEAVNARRVARLMDQIRSAAEAKMAAARYFEEHGTLQGYEGKTSFTISDFDPRTETIAGAKVVFDE